MGRISYNTLFFAVVPLLVLVAGAESWFRVFPLHDAYRTNSGFVEPDDDLIWRLKPQGSGPLVTNVLGLRDSAYRDDADVKILLLGDSVAWGNGIADLRDVFPYRLERRLEELDPERSYEVINAGVPGYSTFQERRYFERDGLSLDPDAVILQFCLNDVVERYNALAEYGGNSFFLGVDTRNAVAGLYGVLLRNSRAFAATARGFHALARGREEFNARSLARSELGGALERAWERTLTEIDEIRLLAAERALPLLLLIAPFRFQAEDPAGLRQPQDRLIAYARSRGLPYVDALAQLAAQTDLALREAFNDASHFSVRGHAFVGEMLAAPVAKLVAR